MQDDHTEHIDKLDNYYKETLENASVDPPADMWDRVSTALDKQEKPKGGWGSKKWLSPLILLFIVGSTSIYYISTTDKEDNNTKNAEEEITIPTPIEIQKNEVENVTNSSKKTSSTQKPIITSSKKDNTSTTQPIVEEQNNGVDQTVIAPSTKPTEEILTTPEPIVEKVTPKKKLGFREKHTEVLKDSVRPLFVPTK